MTFSSLSGIRVVEMSHMIMGPSCGMILAQMGAEVIKVEPPEGDRTRELTGMGVGFYPLFNRGKRSLQLDLKSETGQKALHALLATADVFIENFRDASLERMGIAPEALRARYPSLITVSHKGFLNGPYKDRTAMDEVVQMMTGLAYMTGPTGRPLRVGSSANDIMGGLFGALGIVAALMDRQKSGAGRQIRVGLFENCLLLVAQHMLQYELEGTIAPPMPERDFSWPVYDIFETRDGTQIFVGAVTAGHWTALCRILGQEALLEDPGLQTAMDRINARKRTLPLFAEAIRALDAGAFSAALEAAGLPHSPIARPADMYADPHVNRPGGLISSAMPDGRRFRAPGLPLDIDGEPLAAAAEVRAAGADSLAILREIGCEEALVATPAPVAAQGNRP
ncbi:CaiB/BaiF CoA transferase family protein [Oceanibacterium hippocampi]|uniref:Formyl-coenzyme A transferase n=1 Tax=Oceanibacterium hippocampi TaxID=745714 RepID=A0A1Y5S4G8_9PROT|nr:CoA transferase [Oceanibacterium hippocampi]SLN32462.1 Formyl-coenzyme A transferase [Oceanibacterium hippocampi]